MNKTIDLEKKILFLNYNDKKKKDKILKNYNLLNLIFNSYKNFLKFYLKNILKSVFPLQLAKNKLLVFLSGFKFIYPNKSYYYCLNKGLTYSLSLKLKISVCKYNMDYNLKLKKKFLKNEYILVPNIPYITNNGTYVINGIEKVVIFKLERSPGIYFITNKKKEYIIKIVPDKGREIDFIIDKKNIICLKCFKSKIPISVLFKSLGISFQKMVYLFYNFIQLVYVDLHWKIIFNEKLFLNYRIPFDIYSLEHNFIIKKNTIIDTNIIFKVKDLNISYFKINSLSINGNILYENIYLKEFKLYPAGHIIDNDFLLNILKNNITNFKLLIYESDNHYSLINTFKVFNNSYFDSIQLLNEFFKNIGFNIINYNIISNNYYKNIFSLFPICRKKLNVFLKTNFVDSKLCLNDIINIIKLLISFKEGNIKETDSLNLNNLSANIIGDILENIFFNFFYKIKNNVEIKNFSFNKKIRLLSSFNIGSLLKEIKSFFTLSKYCQYLDRVNDVSEISHKRKITTISVIGISKKYSGFDCRDLSSTHYSRICPVETPEGIGIGLINSLSLLCNVDNYKLLTAPYFKIFSSGKISKKWTYLSVEEEFNSFISDSIKNYKAHKNIALSFVKYKEQLVLVNSKLSKYINVFPYQILSTTALLIPFIENNDSNRALMACNMLRQALPLIKTDVPLVYTGFEELIANNSKQNLFCYNKSFLNYSDSRFLIVDNLLYLKDSYYVNYDIYFLIKYMPSNQKTSVSQHLNSFEKTGVGKNDILARGSCVKNNLICLGNNLLTAVLSWEGYNFEDSIVISDRLVKEDIYTSLELIQIDINVFKVMNKSEKLTKNIRLKHNNLRNKLNNFGIIKLGSIVKGGDVLVGKTCLLTNKDNDEISSNYKILSSIFNENDFRNKDTSFYVPEKFSEGTVVSSEIFFSDESIFDAEDELLINYQINNFLKFKKRKFKIIKKKIKTLIKNFLINKKIFYKNYEITISKKFLFRMSLKEIIDINIINEDYLFDFQNIKRKINFFLKTFDILKKEIRKKYLKKLPTNVNKIIRLKIAIKNSIKVGDKMSGRYGNKGVVSKILPKNQMPYLKNGEIVDIIINPLGIPSRMNIGQLLELHTGFISWCLYLKINNIFANNKLLFELNEIMNVINLNEGNLKSLSYDKLSKFLKKKKIFFQIKPFEKLKYDNYIEKISKLIFKNNFLYDLNLYGEKKNISLFDGRTGEKFENNSNAGIMYFYKLNHLSEEKLHARSVGPYSMITQQPLKGKSNMGGQRLGEMEVWALEAYGAFYTLQEMLTIKSDDVVGRFESYRKIVKGIYNLNFNLPETFNVMMKNINSLMLYIRFNDY